MGFLRFGSRMLWVALAVVATANLTGKAMGAEEAGKIHVVSTIFPVADWVGQVGGDRVTTAVLVPAGASPHTFEPSPAEMRGLSRAKVFFTIGLGYDNWAAKLASGGGKGLSTVALGDSLKRRKQLPDVSRATAGQAEIESSEASHDHDHDHDHGGVDPHYWLDPALAKLSVMEIRDALKAADPANAAVFEHNAAGYIAELDTLDSELSGTLAKLRRREFVSFHNAYSYFATRYGLRIAAVIEEYPGKTPSNRYVMNVAKRLRELKLTTVFSEPQFSPRMADILAKEIGGTVDMLDPLGGPGIEGRDSYVAILRFNGAQLVRCLGTKP
ncbi:MAG: metal ABC transporter substrate-binding protein [Candidatus Sumerlaeaceae bacterium]|nr:metal ABC transporter substrate-binding protein [Candidatus Sumerlaeaceae bacterium]